MSKRHACRWWGSRVKLLLQFGSEYKSRCNQTATFNHNASRLTRRTKAPFSPACMDGYWINKVGVWIHEPLPTSPTPFMSPESDRRGSVGVLPPAQLRRILLIECFNPPQPPDCLRDGPRNPKSDSSAVAGGPEALSSSVGSVGTRFHSHPDPYPCRSMTTPGHS